MRNLNSHRVRAGRTHQDEPSPEQTGQMSPTHQLTEQFVGATTPSRRHTVGASQPEGANLELVRAFSEIPEKQFARGDGRAGGGAFCFFIN